LSREKITPSLVLLYDRIVAWESIANPVKAHVNKAALKNVPGSFIGCGLY
jgi:hypothetical protein